MTHKSLTILLLYFFNLSQSSLYAEDKLESRFRFGIESNIGISDRYKVGKLPKDYNTSDELLNLFNDLEGPKFSQEYGIVFDFAVKRNLHLLAGVKHIEWGSSSKKVKPLVLAEYSDFKIKVRNQFLEIPIRLKYYIHNKKSRLYISCGYSPTIHLNTVSIATLYYPERKEKIKDKDVLWKLRRLNMTGEIGMGYENTISKKLVFSICPNFRIQNFTFGNDDQIIINRRLFFYGISFSLTTEL